MKNVSQQKNNLLQSASAGIVLASKLPDDNLIKFFGEHYQEEGFNNTIEAYANVEDMPLPSDVINETTWNVKMIDLLKNEKHVFENNDCEFSKALTRRLTEKPVKLEENAVSNSNEIKAEAINKEENKATVVNTEEKKATVIKAANKKKKTF